MKVCHQAHYPPITIEHGKSKVESAMGSVSVHAFCAPKSSSVYVWVNGVCVSFRIPREWSKKKKP